MFSGNQIAAILSSLPDPVFILTRSGRYAAIFGGSDKRYYHDSSNLVGKRIHDVLNKEKADWFLAEIAKALESGTFYTVEYGLAGHDVLGLPQDGPQEMIWFEGRIQALGHLVDGEDAVIWVASNITARKELELQLRLQSETDTLTGLANRRKLMECLKTEYEVLVRYGTKTSLLLFDIDHFKRINDEYGHASGDQVLVTVATVCQTALRNTDIVARLGGDEFVVLMPHTDLDQALQIAERLRLLIAEALCASGEFGIGTTVSGGLSEMTSDDASCDVVLKRADVALYQAKRDGRDRISKN